MLHSRGVPRRPWRGSSVVKRWNSEEASPSTRQGSEDASWTSCSSEGDGVLAAKKLTAATQERNLIRIHGGLWATAEAQHAIPNRAERGHALNLCQPPQPVRTGDSYRLAPKAQKPSWYWTDPKVPLPRIRKNSLPEALNRSLISFEQGPQNANCVLDACQLHLNCFQFAQHGSSTKLGIIASSGDFKT